MAYLLTFTTYGTWLHGDRRGSVDPAHAGFDSPTLTPNGRRRTAMRAHMDSPEISLSAARRTAIEAAIREVCRHRGWALEAINVRTNHVHVVVGATDAPERMLNDFKAYATRRCRGAGLLDIGQRLWTRHGSTRYLWTERDIELATEYVVDGQGHALPGVGSQVETS
jgi:REP element-mobilizing transposase RayT